MFISSHTKNFQTPKEAFSPPERTSSSLGHEFLFKHCFLFLEGQFFGLPGSGSGCRTLFSHMFYSTAEMPGALIKKGPGSEFFHSGSLIPDPGVTKAPDPGSWIRARNTAYKERVWKSRCWYLSPGQGLIRVDNVENVLWGDTRLDYTWPGSLVGFP